VASEARQSSTLTTARTPSEALRAVRATFLASGLLQTQLAQAIGVDPQVIRHIVSGRVSLATADKLFVYFGLAIESYPGGFSEALRAAIKASGKSGLTISSESGVGEEAIYRLLRGDPGTRLATAETLFVFLGLRLSIAGGTVKRSDRPKRPTLSRIQAAIKASGLGTTALARKSGVSTCTILLIKKDSPRLNLKDITITKLAKPLGIDWEPSYAFSLSINAPVARPMEPPSAEVPLVEPTRPRPEPSPWDDWDPSICPVHVREDGHLVVFGRVKKRLGVGLSKLASELTARYPDGGFGLYGLVSGFGKGARQSFYRLVKIDADCGAAFQPAIVKGSLYRIGRPKQ
jgi:transcriptional regulator with XRE-family HTH domain